jgi:hypothetical protein
MPSELFQGQKPEDLSWDDIEYGAGWVDDIASPLAPPHQLVTTVRIAQRPVYHNLREGHVTCAFLRRAVLCLKVNGNEERMTKAFMLSWLAYHKMSIDYLRATANGTDLTAVDPDTLTWWWMLEPKGTERGSRAGSKRMGRPRGLAAPPRPKPPKLNHPVVDLQTLVGSNARKVIPARDKRWASENANNQDGQGEHKEEPLSPTEIRMNFFHGMRPQEITWIEYGLSWPHDLVAPQRTGPADNAQGATAQNRFVTTICVGKHPVYHDRVRRQNDNVSGSFLRQVAENLRVRASSDQHRKSTKSFLLSWLAYHKMTLDYFRATNGHPNKSAGLLDPDTLTWWWMVELENPRRKRGDQRSEAALAAERETQVSLPSLRNGDVRRKYMRVYLANLEAPPADTSTGVDGSEANDHVTRRAARTSSVDDSGLLCWNDDTETEHAVGNMGSLRKNDKQGAINQAPVLAEAGPSVSLPADPTASIAPHRVAATTFRRLLLDFILDVRLPLSVVCKPKAISLFNFVLQPPNLEEAMVLPSETEMIDEVLRTATHPLSGSDHPTSVTASARNVELRGLLLAFILDSKLPLSCVARPTTMSLFCFIFQHLKQPFDRRLDLPSEMELLDDLVSRSSGAVE